MGHEYYDNVLNRDVMEFSYRGDKWRFPKILGERFEVSKLLAVSGFGALLVAKDKWIFNRKVLIKTGFLNKSELCTPNNASLPELVKRINVQYVREQKFLLHGQMRHITGIPTLIDWMYDVSPMIRGPHTAVDGQQIYHDNPNCWQSVFYLVLSYFDGKQLDEYCRDKPKAIINKPTEFFRFLMFYLVDVLLALHRQQPLNAKKMHFIYQDLKPANILISPSEKRYCLIDFGGMAACVSDSPPINPGIFTEEFAPPEAKKVPFDAESVKPTWDIYTLGATIRKCMQLAEVESKCSTDFGKLLDRCTEPKIENRFQNMSDVAGALKRV